MFSCDLCEFVCGKEGFLKMHIQRIHEKKFICSGSAAKCDFVGRKKKELDEHLKICHKEELSNCSLCNYATVRKAVLRSHIERVHKQMKKFRCAKCNCQKQWEDEAEEGPRRVKGVLLPVLAQLA